MKILFFPVARKLSLIAVSVALGIVVPSITYAISTIVMDGTTGTHLGTPTPIIPVGTQYTIDGASHGTQSGSNLFFNFSQFGIGTGDSALFQCPSCVGVTNVISRVTGSQPSTFNGPLVSTIGTANFWFFNPVGVQVNAAIHVPTSASVHINDATQINFNTGKAFGASSGTISTLSAATPASFGFISSSSSSSDYYYRPPAYCPSKPTPLSSLVQAIPTLAALAKLPEPLPPCDNNGKSSLLVKSVANYVPVVSSQAPYSVLGAEAGAVASSEQASEQTPNDTDDCYAENN